MSPDPIVQSGADHRATTLPEYPGAQLRFAAMGTHAHVIVTDTVGSIDPTAMCRLAEQRISDLESKWSRFLPTSEIALLNAARRGGSAEPHLSADTTLLIARAEEGRVITGGRFDPYVLRAVQSVGYDRYVDTAPSPAERPASDGDGSDMRAADEFDPGGIGKGLAADLVVAELMEAGAAGVLVNLGGDLRVNGVAPGGGDWVIDIDHPKTGGVIATVSLAAGAVATSSQMKRRWVDEDGHLHNHLIDPEAGASTRSPVLSATVIAAQGWQAEVLAKPLLLDWSTGTSTSTDGGYRDPLEIIEEAGCAALVVTDAVVATSARWDLYAVSEPGDPSGQLDLADLPEAAR